AAQRAIVEAQHGAQLRWQSELFPLDAAARERAADILRSARLLLQPLPADLEQRMRAALSPSAGARQDTRLPPPHQFRDLRRAVEFRLAVATVDLAKVLPTGADRAEALHQADAALKELAKTPKPDEVAWLAEVLLIEVHRLRGDFDRVRALVTALLGKGPPTEIRDAAVAQWVRADLDAGRPDAALERLQSHRREHGTDADELGYLMIETLLAARQIAFEKNQLSLAKELLAEANSYAADLAGAWGVRGRVIIDAAQEAETYGPQLAESVRRAKWSWRNGDLASAIAAYYQAVTEAHRSGQGEFAAELAVTLATLQIEVRQYDDAIATLSGLLDSYPDSARAADAHLLRGYAFGRQYEQKPDEERRGAYEAELKAHRHEFAGSATAVEATWMLARLAEHERRWSDAVELLESIPPDSSRGPEAQARIAIVYDDGMADLMHRGISTADWEQRAVAALTTATMSFPPHTEALSDSEQEVAWRLARLLLGQPTPDFHRADGLLERVQRSAPILAGNGSNRGETVAREPSARTSAVSQLRIISLAGQGRLDEAREIVQQWNSDDPDRLLTILSGLADAAQRVALEHRQTVGTLQLEVSQRLDEQRDAFTDEQKWKLDQSLAQAYAALGRNPQAAAVYEKMLWQRPQDVRVIESLARLYDACGTIGCLRNALKQWQALERLQRKGSPEWLESRYQLANCNHRLGDADAARKLIGVTRVLYPELGNPALKEKFDQLEAALREQTGKSPAPQK
ncbi:MAG: tetratricopeptide repeat protein, partial [Planctomycetaceae bacterium]|nr:tetratricopeptide repeat protein [Planctomycetaceae bacterium]